MYDLNQIKPKSEFPYFFRRCGISDFFEVFKQEIDTSGEIQQTRIGRCPAFLTAANMVWNESFSDRESVDMNVVIKSFGDFKSSRPEFLVGTMIPKETIEANHYNAMIYEKLIVGGLFLQHDEPTALARAAKVLEFLRGSGMYTSPGSIRHHDNFDGGLLQHTLRVVNHTVALLHLATFRTVVPHQAIIAACVHDWCKHDIYRKTTRMVKNEETGQWERQPWYEYRNSATLFGHGASSLYIAKQYFDLTMEQALAIRWHMGAWSVAQWESSDLSASNETYPMCLLLQWADQSSITVYGVDIP
jgi:hypothetical protein